MTVRVCVVGLGYIGFPTACLAARAGHEVIGVDVNLFVVQRLANGGLHIVNESGLAELAEAALGSGKLRVATVPEPADIFIIAVPTPFCSAPAADEAAAAVIAPACLADAGDGPEASPPFLANLSFVEAAVRSLAPHLKPGNLVILESTVPPRTTEEFVRATLERDGVDVARIHFAHAPERVLPGNVVKELVDNDRVVGGLTPEATRLAGEFYQTFVKGEVFSTDAATAELVKLMENTFRDVNIALANEFAKVGEALGIDVWEAIRLANRHPRVNFLRPGPGVGGHCIAVDPYFVVEAAPAVTPLIQTARMINRGMPGHVVQLLTALAGERFPGSVAVLGVAYKADVGDDRESPAYEVIERLRGRGARVSAHDPYVEPYTRPLEDVLAGVEAIVLLTDHRVYRSLEPYAVGRLVTRRLLLDTRGLLEAGAWQGAGFRVARLGVGVLEAPPGELGGEASSR